MCVRSMLIQCYHSLVKYYNMSINFMVRKTGKTLNVDVSKKVNKLKVFRLQTSPNLYLVFLVTIFIMYSRIVINLFARKTT